MFCILDASVVNWDFQWCKWKLGCWLLFTFTGKEAFTSKGKSGKNPFWNDPYGFVQVLQSLGQSDLSLLGTDSTRQFLVMLYSAGAPGTFTALMAPAKLYIKLEQI